MEALNQKERTSAFWKFFLTFLLLVVVTVLLVLVADMAVPAEEVEALREENEMLKGGDEQAKSNAALVATIYSDMQAYRADSLNNNPAGSAALKAKVIDEILKLQTTSTDSGSLSRIKISVGLAYSEWMRDIQRIKQSAGGTSRIIELQNQLDEIKKENAQNLQNLQYYMNIANAKKVE